ncbi:MAG: ribosomal-processing cysteine protease Prp, partial [Anaerotignaceae bacterium]
MIKVDIYRNKEYKIYGFKLDGHADYSQEGNDIICSAVSILVINTINAIEKFTTEEFQVDADEKNGGFINCYLPNIKEGEENKDVELLVETMLLGLNSIKDEYSC